jgi:L-cysteate sulfo-lyase
MNLGRFARIRFAHLPTPLEPMPRLSEQLGGPTLWVKRDDCTGLATGGNKTRKLEYLLGEAQREGADTIITQGAYQSNHVRQTAAAAARLGLRCEVVLEHSVASVDEDYRRSGNRFLDDLLGATIHEAPSGADLDAAMARVADSVRERGGHPYAIPAGGSNPVGALGYVHCALELVSQAAELGLRIDHVVHATCSAGTQAGLVAGMVGLNAGATVLGISVKAGRAAQEAHVHSLAAATADLVGIAGGVPRSAVVVDSNYVGSGYGIPTAGMLRAVRDAARLEGLLLDPVYSGKALDGLADLCRRGHFSKRDHVVFVHTGGTASLFAYLGAFAD